VVAVGLGQRGQSGSVDLGPGVESTSGRSLLDFLGAGQAEHPWVRT